MRRLFPATLLLLAAGVAPAEETPPHWAFQRPLRPAVPDLGHPNPIDAFLAAKHEELGLTPAPPAPRSLLLRRVYLDLIGLPPTLEQLQADDTYEDIVQQLLTSPQHGERWGRHWMDVWRYSDWFGTEGKGRITNGLPHLWRWRDWIVESLNADKGYDRMIVEMLAGDELAPSDPDILRATGFLVRNRYRLDRNVPLSASVEHTGRAFIGLTLECARCHEHKYDPITHEDYYRLRAVFEPIGFRVDRVPGEPDTEIDGLARVYDAEIDRATYLFEKGDERRPVEDQPLEASVPKLFGDLMVEPVVLKPEESNPWLRPWMGEGEIARLEGEIERLQQKDNKALTKAELESVKSQLTMTKAVLAADRDPASAPAAAEAQNAYKIVKGEENVERAKAKVADFAERFKTDKSRLAQLEAAKKEQAKNEEELGKLREAKPAKTYEPLGEVYPDKSTGRRLALANWLVSARNPLAARVAVNHIWLRHFGQPLVPTVFDFGVAGKPPWYPELLDWLAVEFVESGWSHRHLHQLIVTSDAYQRSSSNFDQSTNLTIDPENQFLWRANPRRMEAEVIRDTLLFQAGKLDLTRGGPELPAADADKKFRRSLYFKHSGVDIAQMLEVFDSASVIECYRRRESVVPQQALALANSPIAQSMTRLIASQLDSEDFIDTAFQQLLARKPSDIERSECRQFLEHQSKLLSQPDKLTTFTGGPRTVPPPAVDPKVRARENLVHVLINHNDFVTIR